MAGDGKTDGGSLVGLTADLDLTVQQQDKLFGNGQSQPGSVAVLTKLDKRLENAIQILWGHADPGV